MSSEENDYMSDIFLDEGVTDDIRPGLIHNRSVKRSYEVSKRKKLLEDEVKKRKPVKVLEHENREDGLDTPIASNNKGFEMLRKMGFNPGAGLGLKGQGRAEPLKINLKNDKEGLGRKEAIKELTEKYRKQWREAQKSAPDVMTYRANLVAKAKERQTCGDLRKCQKTCCMLDTKEGITEPGENWFWPRSCVEKKDENAELEDEDDDDETVCELSAEDKLEILTIYLRSNYYYCIWCGVQYTDENDLQNCPGMTKDDH